MEEYRRKSLSSAGEASQQTATILLESIDVSSLRLDARKVIALRPMYLSCKHDRWAKREPRVGLARSYRKLNKDLFTVSRHIRPMQARDSTGIGFSSVLINGPS
jgi:hypothetical protein